MPAVLSSPAEVELWLSEKPWCPEVRNLVKTYEGELVYYQVTPDVGKVQNDRPDFTEPLSKKKGTLASMFAAQSASAKKANSKKEGRSIGINSSSSSPPPAPNDESSPSRTLGVKEGKIEPKVETKHDLLPSQESLAGRRKRKLSEESAEPIEVITLDESD